MFIVLLKFSDKKEQAGKFMEAHKAWLQYGFDNGIFLLSGSLPPGLGGGIITGNTPLSTLEEYVNKDPFVEKGVVQYEIIEIAPSKASEKLAFLLN